MKVVESGYKIDLHIHSVYSRGKDKGKVSYNTIDNIGTLSEKLNENGVQICAITDHDAFNYDIYKKLKKFESDGESSITKVFPGVEFSVQFAGEDGAAVVHVIAIFNDENDEKIARIAACISNDDGTSQYDCGESYSEEKFLSILRDIDLDTVLIAHQKGTLSSSKFRKDDARSVGEDKFNEFVYTDYFEAFEFKNRKNEVFNKNFLNTNNLTDSIRFITGTDCHDWRFYPKETEKDTVEFSFSYVKCLPCFRGLVMAITDHRRIKTVNSFFNPTEVYAPEICMTIDGTMYNVPLSKGINVIIGDNSIGKSLLLHKLTGYCKKQEGILSKTVVTGYDAYLKKNAIELKTEIPASSLFAFDMQGEVRDKFEQERIKSDDFLKDYYPATITADAYREKVQRELQKIYNYLEEKFAIELLEKQLAKFQIAQEDSSAAESLTFVGSVSRDNKKVEGYNGISGDLDSVAEKLETIKNSRWIEKADEDEINVIIEQLHKLSGKYNRRKLHVERENTKIGLFQTALSSFKQKYQASVSDAQKKISLFNENVENAADTISSIIKRRRGNQKPSCSLQTESINILTNRVYDYEFNSRLGIIEISETYIQKLISDLMRKDVKKSVLEMTQEELSDALLYYTGSPADALKELKDRVKSRLDEDFSNKFTITQAGEDKTQELSAGFNSKIYFDLLSYESTREGIYIIDQPEDNISQKAIHEYLLDRFKIMGEHRQVIIVTHNPQFIVNLDVDNVIYIGKDNGKIYVQSGALEYKDTEYSVLDIISNHIEGGLDTLKRRWKRYEKNASL